MMIYRNVTVIMLIIGMSGMLFGKKQVSADGEMIIPGANPGQLYKYSCRVLISPEKIEIRTNKRIFRPFNDTGTPYQDKLILPVSEIRKIMYGSECNCFYIFPHEVLLRRYRHLCHMTRVEVMRRLFYFIEIVQSVIVIKFADVEQVSAQSKSVILLINQKNRPKNLGLRFLSGDPCDELKQVSSAGV